MPCLNFGTWSQLFCFHFLLFLLVSLRRYLVWHLFSSINGARHTWPSCSLSPRWRGACGTRNSTASKAHLHSIRAFLAQPRLSNCAHPIRYKPLPKRWFLQGDWVVFARPPTDTHMRQTTDPTNAIYPRLGRFSWNIPQGTAKMSHDPPWKAPRGRGTHHPSNGPSVRSVWWCIWWMHAHTCRQRCRRDSLKETCSVLARWLTRFGQKGEFSGPDDGTRSGWGFYRFISAFRSPLNLLWLSQHGWGVNGFRDGGHPDVFFWFVLIAQFIKLFSQLFTCFLFVFFWIVCRCNFLQSKNR